MIELEKREYYILPMMAHEGEKSLDAIATKFYGKTYRGQQTGDMIPNDTDVTFDFSNANFLTWYRGDEAQQRIADWLALEIGGTYYHWWDGKRVAQHETDIERAAPTPNYILADLIIKGQLPMGRYLSRVWW